jgi:hypothetical protein
MANTQNQSGQVKSRMLVRLWLRIDALYDLFFSETNKAMLRQLVIFLGLAGFVIHLALIFLARSLAHPPLLIAEAGHNYLSAISTPFNFILFYEVLILISALPASTTRSIASQFEIVSLIFIRDVFKDIAAASDLVTQHRLGMDALPAFFDMWGGFLMFFLVGVFRHVALQRTQPSGTAIRSRGAALFIAQKKVVAVGLASLLLGMAVYNIGLLAFAILVMIFTDVLILILSLVVSGVYELVFRNAAFVVSTILIRLSLSEGYPFGAPLALMSMVFGILTLLVFNFHMRLKEPSSG